MKRIFQKIKNFLTDSWIGIFIYSSIVLLWSFGVFEGTIINNTLNVIAVIVGICIFGFLLFCIVVTICDFIKESLKKTSRNDISSVLTDGNCKEKQK